MRNIVTIAKGFALAGIIAMIGSLAPGIGAGDARAQSANGKRSSSSQVAAAQEPQQANGMQSIMRISEAGLPAHKKLRMGLNKSTVLEVPRHLQDVLISDPSVVDAVVQTSNRIFLLAKKSGVANAFFFDNHGQQFLTLELYVERDGSGLEVDAEPSVGGSPHQDRDDQRGGGAERQCPLADRTRRARCRSRPSSRRSRSPRQAPSPAPAIPT